ncbi:phosphoglycerate dehydrogenase [Facilibium subflavum]|uniref:phosphoglycerate dehydrogenase n=1 Tax=Facilibium subflavum TaxID=2219058 RepID=UPI000E65ABD0|nr:phosphoglycerate dehydrogenase [Facilibium subflavum]
MTITTSVDKKQLKILLLEGIHAKAKQTFIDAGYTNIETLHHALDDKSLIEKLKKVKIVGVRSRTQLNQHVLQESPHISAIGCFCIGTNQVDLPVAQKLGIPVFNAPFSNTRSVAELVIGQMILLFRNVIDKNQQMHQKQWQKSAQGAHEVRGKTLGIVGYGHIGSQVSVLAESLGLNIVYYDIDNKLPLGNARQLSSLKALLKQSDIVTLHVPDTPLTRNLITTPQLEMMKANSVLINASRGHVVDINALCQTLRTGKLKGAGIDVFPEEPSSNDEPFNSPLVDFDNVFLTPHIGGSTQEAQENIALEVAHKLIKYSDNGSTLSAVNFPEISLPTIAEENIHRILHIHHNQPGVMRAINRIFSDLNVNVEGQFLRTLGEIGYVVVDINSDQHDSSTLIKKLKSIDGTIRARILF